MVSSILYVTLVSMHVTVCSLTSAMYSVPKNNIPALQKRLNYNAATAPPSPILHQPSVGPAKASDTLLARPMKSAVDPMVANRSPYVFICHFRYLASAHVLK
jgi:hypothetical protein